MQVIRFPVQGLGRVGALKETSKSLQVRHGVAWLSHKKYWAFLEGPSPPVCDSGKKEHHLPGTDSVSCWRGCKCHPPSDLSPGPPTTADVALLSASFAAAASGMASPSRAVPRDRKIINEERKHPLNWKTWLESSKLAPLLGPEVGVTCCGYNVFGKAPMQTPRALNSEALGGQLGFSQASSVGAGVWKAAGYRSTGTQTGRGAHTSVKMWDIKDGALVGDGYLSNPWRRNDSELAWSRVG